MFGFSVGYHCSVRDDSPAEGEERCSASVLVMLGWDDSPGLAGSVGPIAIQCPLVHFVGLW